MQARIMNVREVKMFWIHKLGVFRRNRIKLSERTSNDYEVLNPSIVRPAVSFDFKQQASAGLSIDSKPAPRKEKAGQWWNERIFIFRFENFWF